MTRFCDVTLIEGDAKHTLINTIFKCYCQSLSRRQSTPGLVVSAMTNCVTDLVTYPDPAPDRTISTQTHIRFPFKSRRAYAISDRKLTRYRTPNSFRGVRIQIALYTEDYNNGVHSYPHSHKHYAWYERNGRSYLCDMNSGRN